MNNPTIFPKDMTACPDFWTVNPNGTCQIPTHAPGEKSAVNSGKLDDSQKTLYTQYTYPTSTPDRTGKLLDTLLDISNISYLRSYGDPGTSSILRGKRTIPIPTDYHRGNTISYGSISSNKIYRYDICNNIPYGYTIRNPGVIDFKDKGWATYGDPYCAIQSWAKQNNIAWDGMMAYNKC